MVYWTSGVWTTPARTTNKSRLKFKRKEWANCSVTLIANGLNYQNKTKIVLFYPETIIGQHFPSSIENSRKMLHTGTPLILTVATNLCTTILIFYDAKRCVQLFQ